MNIEQFAASVNVYFGDSLVASATDRGTVELTVGKKTLELDMDGNVSGASSESEPAAPAAE